MTQDSSQDQLDDPSGVPNPDEHEAKLDFRGKLAEIWASPFTRKLLAVSLPLLAALAGGLWLLQSRMEEDRQAALSVSVEEIAQLADRVRNTVTRDLTEKLHATEILEVDVQAVDPAPDGSLRLTYTASYTQADEKHGKVSRAIESVLKIARKDGDWRVTSISPQGSALIFEDAVLVQSAAIGAPGSAPPGNEAAAPESMPAPEQLPAAETLPATSEEAPPSP